MKKIFLTLLTIIGSVLIVNTGAVLASAGPPSVPIVPEPISSTLFVVGGAVLAYRHIRRKK